MATLRLLIGVLLAGLLVTHDQIRRAPIERQHSVPWDVRQGHIRNRDFIVGFVAVFATE